MLASAAPADAGPPPQKKSSHLPLYERPWLWLFMVIFYCSKWQNPFVWAETAFLIAANWSWDKRPFKRPDIDTFMTPRSFNLWHH